MFQHSYESYLSHAYPYDELRPLTCDGVDTWGSYSLTLIDALDTLAVMGNFSEFNRSVNPTSVQGCGYKSGSVSGSGFSRVSGSGSGFGIRIRIQEGKNDPQKKKKCFKVHV